ERLETATWQETLAGAEVTIAQLSAKISIAKRKEDYLKKDEEFRLHRAEISRHLAWIQIAEHCRTGSELNYDERLKSVKALFDANLKPLAERLLILEQGLRSLYGIDLPIGKPANGRLLDEAVVWLARASEEIAKWQRTQRLSLIAIPSQGTIKLTESGSFEATFAVDDQSMPAQDGLLRGVNLEFQGTGGGPIQAWLKPPAIVGAEGGLMFGRVCAVAPGLDLRPQQSEQVWNKDPRGEWKATGTAQPAFGIPSRLLLYLWVSSR
uniref:hypothetical protein n=1 Tax=Methylobacterium sp. B34 TaxID=95563 RepID=UPI001955280F